MVEYTSMAQANLAWAARREGKIDEALQLGETAWTFYKNTMQSQILSWVAAWPLVAIYVAQERLAEAMNFVSTMINPVAVQPPAPIAKHLHAAITAWEQGQPEAAESELQQAAALAEPLGYI
jgi:tetratricopeptide (TPR) repeat protein